MGKLTPKQERFVAEYLIDLNATQAAIRAGYLIKTARQQGSRLLTNADIAQAEQNGRKEVTEQLEVDSRWVLQRWIEIATADPNELIQYRRGGACADCWDAEDVGKVDARPDCVKCHGEGRGSVFVHDTRKLKGSARKLYAGVQLGKDGIKVLMRDQARCGAGQHRAPPRHVQGQGRALGHREHRQPDRAELRKAGG
jgi:phage terminase small subunit